MGPSTVRALRLVVAAVVVTAAACAPGPSQPSDGRLVVVAGGDVWGSLAAQLGGDRVAVTSLASNPGADPHDYEPTAADGRAVASAGYVIANGIGYDPWIDNLLKASPSTSRSTLNVGALVGLKAGANPHQWYAPSTVDRVIVQITTDYKRLRPAEAAYFDQRHAELEANGMADYRAIIADIKSTHAGSAVGASESIFLPLAEALGLQVITPPAFVEAVSEGAEPTAADKQAVDAQIATKAVKVFVVNVQSSTPDVRRLVDAAKAKGIPVVSVTETITPAGTAFTAWQAEQMRALKAALAAAPA